MSLTHKRIEAKILAKIKIYDLTRAELLFTLCHEIPCRIQIENNNWGLETCRKLFLRRSLNAAALYAFVFGKSHHFHN